MNCERAERLLPLHAGGDLAEGRERDKLTAHLFECDACRRAAREWVEHLSLLRREEPPEFDAAFFDSIRRDVMREIKTDRAATPTLAALLAQRLRPRTLAYAATLALVCAPALLLALRLSLAPQPSGRAGDGVAPSLSKQTPFENATKQPTANPPAQDSQLVKSRARELPSGKRHAVPRPSRQPRVASSSRTPHAVVLPPPGQPNSNAELLASVRDEREMLRIDLRTSDPDVRIIWFSPQPSEQGASPRRTNDRR